MLLQGLLQVSLLGLFLERLQEPTSRSRRSHSLQELPLELLQELPQGLQALELKALELKALGLKALVLHLMNQLCRLSSC